LGRVGINSPGSSVYDMTMPQLYNLYIVTATGFYTAIQGARPTTDQYALNKALTLVETLRPGRGRYYDVATVKVTEDWQPDESGMTQIRDIQKRLYNS
jgi:hypothetical protein